MINFPLRNLLTSIFYFVPRDRIVKMVYCCDLELQTSNIEWGSGVFCIVYCKIKRVVLFGAVKVLLKDYVSTNYVAACST